MGQASQFKQGLTFRFLIVLGGLVIFGQLIFALLAIVRTYRLQNDDLFQKATTQASFLGSVSPDNILGNNFYPLETLMRETAEDPDIVYSLIVHQDGRILTTYLNRDDETISQAIAQSDSTQFDTILDTITQNDNIVEISTPIVAEGLLIGEVRLAYRTNAVTERLRDSLLVTLSSALLVSALLALAVITLLNVQIRQPLLQLGNMAQQFSKGNYDRRIEPQGGSEIQTLQRSFNHMAQQLQENLDELNKLSYVASRTKSAVIITDPQGKAEWVNDAFTRITEFELNEVIGKSPGSLLQGPKSDPEIVAQMSRSVAQGEPFEVELINYTKSRREYWISIEVQPVYDDNRELINFIAIETDVTERKMAQRQLQTYAASLETANDSLLSQQMRLRNLLQIATQSSTTEEQIHEVLVRGTEMLQMDLGLVCRFDDEGLTIMDVFGKKSPQLKENLVIDDDPNSLPSLLRQDGVFNQIDPTWFENKICFPTDHYKPQAIISTGLTINDTPFGTLTFLSEAVRPEKFTESEQDFIKLAAEWVNVTLERQVARDELTTYAQELERSNRELQDFAYVASHDLQEPLRKIQAFGSRLEKSFSDDLGERGVDYLQRMQNAAGRMQLLINDLLSYSRIATQADPFVPVDLEKVAREVLLDLEYTIEESQGTITISPLRTVDADAGQIRQLFQNLIGNALKFAHPERLPIIHVSEQLIMLDEHPYVELTVSDNGIGFDEKYRDRIFNIFQRLHGRDSYSGTGVGLAICRKIAQRHKGSIEVSSEPGKGSEFRVLLPLHQQ